MDLKLSTSLAAAMVALAGSGFSAAALAGDPTPDRDSTAAPTVTPSANDSQDNSNKRMGNDPYKPSVGVLDDNAQRAHDPNQRSAQTSGSEQIAAGEVRDWESIDLDHDHLISPDEMQQYLDKGSAGGQTK
jgi:hypothetical protein